jgi:hypothetical protein
VRLLAHGAVARLRAPEVPALPAAAIELAAEVAVDAADPLAAAADA